MYTPLAGPLLSHAFRRTVSVMLRLQDLRLRWHSMNGCLGSLSDLIDRSVSALTPGTRSCLELPRTLQHFVSDLLVDQDRFLPQHCSPTAEILQCCLSAVAHRQIVARRLPAHRTGSRHQRHRTGLAMNLHCFGFAVAGFALVLAALVVAFALGVVGWSCAGWFGGWDLPTSVERWYFVVPEERQTVTETLCDRKLLANILPQRGRISARMVMVVVVAACALAFIFSCLAAGRLGPGLTQG